MRPNKSTFGIVIKFTSFYSKGWKSSNIPLAENMIFFFFFNFPYRPLKTIKKYALLMRFAPLSHCFRDID
jgi:hypothetical protein